MLFQKFHRNYEFVHKMKEKEVEKLKEELQEETNPRKVEKIKYLIQRMVTTELDSYYHALVLKPIISYF